MNSKYSWAFTCTHGTGLQRGDWLLSLDAVHDGGYMQNLPGKGSLCTLTFQCLICNKGSRVCIHFAFKDRCKFSKESTTVIEDGTREAASIPPHCGGHPTQLGFRVRNDREVDTNSRIRGGWMQWFAEKNK